MTLVGLAKFSRQITFEIVIKIYIKICFFLNTNWTEYVSQLQIVSTDIYQ